MARRVTKWIVCTVGIAVVAAAGVFLSLQSLDNADKWSSVGGFLAALITVVVSAAAWALRRDAAEAGAPPRARRWSAFNWRNGVVINGDNTVNRVEYRTDD